MNNDFAVVVMNLSVKFDDFYPIKNITFSIRRGEIFGFLGANGAGKTTVIRVLCGLLHPTSGIVKIGGIEFKNEKSEMAIKKKIGYMSQKFTLYDDLTVEENLLFIASLRNLNSKTYLERRNFILNFISFQYPLDSFIKNLPGGVRQQVSLAASMLHDPEIIFLDEPTAGVSPATRVCFWALIRDLAKLGKTVFVTTHYMDEAEQCGRICFMRTGKVIALDTPNNLKNEVFPEQLYEFSPRRPYSYLEMKSLQSRLEFEYFEPFGLCFHATLKNPSEIEKLKKELHLDFEIKKIIPTLEDVFIKIIERKVI